MLPSPAYVNTSPSTSCRTTYLPSLREYPSLRTRPSYTATTCAFGSLVTSTSCSPAPLAVALPAALAGAGAGDEPGVVAVVAVVAAEPVLPAEAAVLAAALGLADGETALAPAVALEEDG